MPRLDMAPNFFEDNPFAFTASEFVDASSMTIERVVASTGQPFASSFGYRCRLGCFPYRATVSRGTESGQPYVEFRVVLVGGVRYVPRNSAAFSFIEVEDRQRVYTDVELPDGQSSLPRGHVVIRFNEPVTIPSGRLFVSLRDLRFDEDEELPPAGVEGISLEVDTTKDSC